MSSSTSALTSVVSGSTVSTVATVQKRTTLTTLPDQMAALIIGFAGNPRTTEEVCKSLRHPSFLAFRCILDGYMQHERISEIAFRLMPAKGIIPSHIQCVSIVENTRQAIVEKALCTHIPVLDPIEAPLNPLLDKIQEAEDANLIQCFKIIANQISKKDRPALEGTQAQKASAIRQWMQENTKKLAAITNLDLSNKRLTTLPKEVCQLTGLQHLYLSSNELAGLPIEIGELANLQRLYLDNNQLTQIPDEIGQLDKLLELDLCGNQLTKTPPAAIWQLTKLELLDLSKNQLTQIPAEVGELTHLQGLYLHNNQLAEFPVEIGKLTNLEVLDLTENQLKQIPAVIGRLGNLRDLYLGSNQLTQIPKEIFQLKLEAIDLD